MAVRVLRGMKKSLRGDSTVIMLVRAEHGPAVASALRAACADIMGLDAGDRASPGLPPGVPNPPKYVADPVAIPDGMLIMVDFGEDITFAMRERVPGMIARRLEEAGVQEAAIGPAPRIGWRYQDLDRFRPVARAWFRGVPLDSGAEQVGHRPLWWTADRPGCGGITRLSTSCSAW